ncbi:MAG: hypothetical protein K2X39_07725 [Silvanigrellaceae bacterium]|nr:hypothetical protein [Silvanigrellaceae bacterium]
MNQSYLTVWMDFTRQLQKPMLSMAELNMKTLKNFSYMKPEELSTLKKPEDLMEKHVTVFIENSHNLLNYMQKYFEIVNNSLVELKNSEAVKKAKDFSDTQVMDPFSMKSSQQELFSPLTGTKPTRKRRAKKETKIKTDMELKTQTKHS